MSLKNKHRNILANLIWYASGFNLRDLAKSQHNISDYVGAGGLNVFSTLVIGFISSWASSKFFPDESIIVHFALGAVMAVMVFSFNRQTIKALTHIEGLVKKNRNITAFLPIFLFAIISGVIISIPVKFYVFSLTLITANHTLIQTLTELDRFTDSSVYSKLLSWSISLVLIVIIVLPTLIKYYAIKSNYQKETSSNLNEFMWFCAGANRDILRKCPNDYSKYFGMGGTILFTALMASLSGGYAIYTVFEDATAGICFGIFWGALIFNLDRFIVNSMYSDGLPTIGKQEILGGLPRIIIAIFLGIVISYPLELKIFESEINYSMNVLAKERVIGARKDNSQINAYQSENNERNLVTNDIESLNKELTNWDKQKQNFKPKTHKIVRYDNDGNPIITYPQTNQYNSFLKKYYARYSEIQDAIKSKVETKDDLTAQINEKNKKISQTTEKDENLAKGLKGFSTRMKAFSELKSAEPSTAVASLFIMILFIIIEIAPVLFKMMISSGDYDMMVNTENEIIKSKEIARLSQQNDWANTEIQKVVEENKKKVEQKRQELNAELKANEILLNSLAEAQADLAKIAIEQWKQQELEKIKNDPNYYIKSAVK